LLTHDVIARTHRRVLFHLFDDLLDNVLKRNSLRLWPRLKRLSLRLRHCRNRHKSQQAPDCDRSHHNPPRAIGLLSLSDIPGRDFDGGMIIDLRRQFNAVVWRTTRGP
jgi:hypothetical protein